MNRKSILAVILCSAVSSAYADDNSTPLQILVTTPTRSSLPLEQSLADTTVITSQQIRDSQQPDVASLLRNLAGVEIAQAGGIGQQSSVFMRGTNSDDVLVLVDGVRMDSATTGATALDQVMLDQVDHIEIMRGNASSLYGSSAIGGVIQIFTKQGLGKPALNASLKAGSLNTQSAAAGYSGQSGATNFSLRASRFRTDGVSAINPAIIATANPDKDGYDNNSVTANVRHSLNADNSVSGSLFLSNGHTQFDNPYNLATTDVNTSTSTLQKFSLVSDNRINDIWLSKLQWSQGLDQSRTYLNGNPDPYGSYYRTINRQLAWQNNLVLDDHNTLLAGTEQLIQQLSSDTAYTQTKRTDNALFGGYTGNLDKHQLQLNLRRDVYSDFGKADTGLVGYGYHLTPTLRVYTSYASAFKAPTFNDLYAPSAWGSNPDLKPERSHNTEAGLHYLAHGQQIDFVYFDDVISNLIGYGTGVTLANINRARIYGTELSVSSQMGNTTISGSVTSQNPRDTSTNDLLLRRARLFSSLNLTQKIGVWLLGAEWRYSGTRQDSYTDPVSFNTSRVTLPSYNVFSLTAIYAMSRKTALSLRADNITNQNDSNIYGYNPLGRRIFVGLNYQP